MNLLQQGIDILAPDAAEERRKREEMEAIAARRMASGKDSLSKAYASGVMPGTSLGGYMASVNPAAAPHFAAQGGMIKDTMSAIEKENDSRVNQAREFRRMQHQKEMLRMKLEAEREGDIIRSLLNGR